MLPSSISFTEVDQGAFFCGSLFRRKFDASVPDTGHHLVAFGRIGATFAVAGYCHFMEFGDVILVGGVCTDGDVLRSMSAADREAIAEAGGLYANMLRFGFTRFAERCNAYFGYCGNARAEEVNLSNGFSRTEHPHLLVNFHKPLHPVMQRALVAKAHAIGPF